jgi:hypothetical protein
MLARLANGLCGAAGAVVAAQFPAFYAQYLQNLSGRLAQVRADLAPVLADARARGLSLSEYLTRAEREGGELTGTLVAGYRSAYQALQRLETAHAALSEAGPLARPLAFLRHLDWAIAGSTADAFAPTLPLTAEGGTYALAGLLSGLGLLWLLERPWLLWRRRARRKTETSAAAAAADGGATDRQEDDGA